MTCPDCGSPMQVVDTRHPEPQTVWRRRRCSNCGRLHHTYEVQKSELEELRRLERRMRMNT